MFILAHWLCSKGGLRPSARLKKAFKAGKATPKMITQLKKRAFNRYLTKI